MSAHRTSDVCVCGCRSKDYSDHSMSCPVYEAGRAARIASVPSNQSSDPRVCEHGSLRRKCEICTRDEEIEQLQRELADYAIGHVNQCGEISLLQIERDRLTAERDLLRVGDPKTVAPRMKEYGLE